LQGATKIYGQQMGTDACVCKFIWLKGLWSENTSVRTLSLLEKSLNRTHRITRLNEWKHGKYFPAACSPPGWLENIFAHHTRVRTKCFWRHQANFVVATLVGSSAVGYLCIRPLAAHLLFAMEMSARSHLKSSIN